MLKISITFDGNCIAYYTSTMASANGSHNEERTS